MRRGDSIIWRTAWLPICWFDTIPVFAVRQVTHELSCDWRIPPQHTTRSSTRLVDAGAWTILICVTIDAEDVTVDTWCALKEEYVALIVRRSRLTPTWQRSGHGDGTGLTKNCVHSAPPALTTTWRSAHDVVTFRLHTLEKNQIKLKWTASFKMLVHDIGCIGRYVGNDSTGQAHSHPKSDLLSCQMT